jgi:hypothetical protein
MSGEICNRVSPFFFASIFNPDKRKPPTNQKSVGGFFCLESIRRFATPDSAQLIGKLRNPARQWRKPLALAQDRQEQPEPNRRRGCRRWKQRSACRC